jgi:hypothetical protein
VNGCCNNLESNKETSERRTWRRAPFQGRCTTVQNDYAPLTEVPHYDTVRDACYCVVRPNGLKYCSSNPLVSGPVACVCERMRRLWPAMGVDQLTVNSPQR